MNKLIRFSVFYALLGCCTGAFALAHCPTRFYQNSQQYIVSQDPPGWKSFKPWPPRTLPNSTNFGGAIYSPQKKRVACAYRYNDKTWIVLLSSDFAPIEISNLSKESWKINKAHADYICIDSVKLGLSLFRPEHCTFSINKQR